VAGRVHYPNSANKNSLAFCFTFDFTDYWSFSFAPSGNMVGDMTICCISLFFNTT